METFNALLATPIPTLLIIGGFVFLIVSFITLKKPIVIDVKDKDRRSLRIMGSIILLGGILMSLAPTGEGLGTDTSDPTLENPSALTDSPPQAVVPSDTPTIATAVTLITDTPESESLTGLSDRCIETGIWKIYKGSFPETEQKCWQLNSIGLFGAKDGLHIRVSSPPSNTTQGIFRSVPDNVDVQFTVSIEKFTSREIDPNILGFFGFGIASSNPQGLQSTPSKTMFYYRVLNEGMPINALYGDWGYNNIYKLPADYVPGSIQTIKFSVKDELLEIFVDGVRVSGPVNVSSLTSNRSFYIVFSLLKSNELIANISDFSINLK